MVIGPLITLTLFVMSLTGITLLTVLLICFFAAVQHLWGFGLASSKLRFRNILTISVYSAFPALIAASLAPAFDLPFVNFPLVFFAGFFIYHMVAFNTVQKSLTPPNQQKPSSWDDDDGF